MNEEQALEMLTPIWCLAVAEAMYHLVIEQQADPRAGLSVIAWCDIDGKDLGWYLPGPEEDQMEQVGRLVDEQRLDLIEQKKSRLLVLFDTERGAIGATTYGYLPDELNVEEMAGLVIPDHIPDWI